MLFGVQQRLFGREYHIVSPLFQFLTRASKPKKDKHTLAPVQETWATKSVKDTWTVLRSTPVPPRGDLDGDGAGRVAAAVETLLMRERAWMQWKLDKCPSFVREPSESAVEDAGASAGAAAAAATTSDPAGRKRKRANGHAFPRLDLGSKHITALWNSVPGEPLAACRGARRRYVPRPEPFFRAARAELQDGSLAPERRQVADARLQWRMLRLVARSDLAAFDAISTHVKVPPFKNLTEYLTHIITAAQFFGEAAVGTTAAGAAAAATQDGTDASEGSPGTDGTGEGGEGAGEGAGGGAREDGEGSDGTIPAKKQRTTEEAKSTPV